MAEPLGQHLLAGDFVPPYGGWHVVNEALSDQQAAIRALFLFLQRAAGLKPARIPWFRAGSCWQEDATRKRNLLYCHRRRFHQALIPRRSGSRPSLGCAGRASLATVVKGVGMLEKPGGWRNALSRIRVFVTEKKPRAFRPPRPPGNARRARGSGLSVASSLTLLTSPTRDRFPHPVLPRKRGRAWA